MTLKQEFEKAFNKELKPFSFSMDERAIALWAAKWMAEMCALEAETHCADLLGVEKYTKAGICESVGKKIRQLAKDLS